MKYLNSNAVDVALVNGPWQTIMATAAIRFQTNPDTDERLPQILLVALTESESLLKPVIQNIANLPTNDWQRVIFIERRVDSHGALMAIEKSLCLDRRFVRRLWLSNLRTPTSRAVFSQLSPRFIGLYEDGLHSIAPAYFHELADVNPQPYVKRVMQRLKTVLRSRSGPPRIPFPLHGLGVIAPMSSKTNISWESIEAEVKQVCLDIRNEWLFSSISWETHDILFLGSNFCSVGKLNPSEEYSAISTFIERAIDCDLKVTYRPHPRADLLFTDYLKLKFDSGHFRVWYDDPCWPLECLVHETQKPPTVSLMSSSLFYLNRLLQIPTFRLSHSLLDSRLSTDSLWHELLPFCDTHLNSISAPCELPCSLKERYLLDPEARIP